jgi:hypothetical protein
MKFREGPEIRAWSNRVLGVPVNATVEKVGWKYLHVEFETLERTGVARWTEKIPLGWVLRCGDHEQHGRRAEYHRADPKPDHRATRGRQACHDRDRGEEAPQTR